jgi:hypothetical protein
MQLELASLPRDQLGAEGNLILGDGSATGLVIVPRPLLRQICGQVDGSTTVAPREQLGLLLGPEPQTNDVLVEGTIPLDSKYQSGLSLAMLRAGMESVQPMLVKAWRDRFHAIVGVYTMLTPGEGKVFENGLEFLSASGPEQSLFSSVHCCFLFVAISAAEISLRVLLRQGEHWEQIQEVILQSEAPSPQLTREISTVRLIETERPPQVANAARTTENTARIAEGLRLRDWLWVNLTILSLLFISLAANALVVWFVSHNPRDTVNLKTLTDHVGELSATVSKLRPPADAPVTPEAPVTNPNAGDAVATSRLISTPPPTTRKLAIAKKPTVLRPAEIFQFKVSGNPSPEVRWSSEGPGSIDPFYGMYRAPNEFAGVTTVKITAASWMGKQSVTFTLSGESGKRK